MDQSFFTVAQLAQLLTQKKASSQEIVHLFIQRCKKYNPELGALLEVFDDVASPPKEYATPLSGIPGVVKDNIAQLGRHLTCASRILENYVAPYDATVIAKLKQAGVPLIGRANMDEFAMGSSNETSAFYPARNPWNTQYVPGGSSGGSAVAVAAGLCAWSLGSETGGSVRQPAAFCGITGLKPTYGRISRYGLVAYGSSLDQIGIFTRTAYDAAMVLEVIAGTDEHDPTTIQQQKNTYISALEEKLPAGIRLGVVRHALAEQGMNTQVSESIQGAIKELESLGAQILDVELSSFEYAAAAYFILSRAEAASNLARFDGVRYGQRASNVATLDQMYKQTRHDGFGKEVRARIMVGNYVLSAGHADQFYQKAVSVRRWIAAELDAVFQKVDAIVMPVSPDTAFKLGAFDGNKLKMDLQDYFTCPANLAGVPALSLPCGFVDGPDGALPVGFQLLAPMGKEDRLLQIGHSYQMATDWHLKTPIRDFS